MKLGPPKTEPVSRGPYITLLTTIYIYIINVGNLMFYLLLRVTILRESREFKSQLQYSNYLFELCTRHVENILNSEVECGALSVLD